MEYDASDHGSLYYSALVFITKDIEKSSKHRKHFIAERLMN